MKLGVLAWYELNKDYVADVLCINKDKPDLQCNGKCYLNKQLKKADNLTGQSEKNLPQKEKEVEIITYLLSDAFLISKKYIAADANEHNSRYLQYASDVYLPSVFQPPIM